MKKQSVLSENEKLHCTHPQFYPSPRPHSTAAHPSCAEDGLHSKNHHQSTMGAPPSRGRAARLEALCTPGKTPLHLKTPGAQKPRKRETFRRHNLHFALYFYSKLTKIRPSKQQATVKQQASRASMHSESLDFMYLKSRGFRVQGAASATSLFTPRGANAAWCHLSFRRSNPARSVALAAEVGFRGLPHEQKRTSAIQQAPLSLFHTCLAGCRCRKQTWESEKHGQRSAR